jgi:hypothetical protein
MSPLRFLYIDAKVYTRQGGAVSALGKCPRTSIIESSVKARARRPALEWGGSGGQTTRSHRRPRHLAVKWERAAN